MRDRLVAGLDDARLGVDQREDALAGREPQLELAPERGDAGQREPEEAMLCTNRNQSPAETAPSSTCRPPK